jgi:hypothetical protein
MKRIWDNDSENIRAIVRSICASFIVGLPLLFTTPQKDARKGTPSPHIHYLIVTVTKPAAATGGHTR